MSTNVVLKLICEIYQVVGLNDFQKIDNRIDNDNVCFYVGNKKCHTFLPQ